MEGGRRLVRWIRNLVSRKITLAAGTILPHLGTWQLWEDLVYLCNPLFYENPPLFNFIVAQASQCHQQSKYFLFKLNFCWDTFEVFRSQILKTELIPWTKQPWCSNNNTTDINIITIIASQQQTPIESLLPARHYSMHFGCITNLWIQQQPYKVYFHFTGD